MFHGLKKYVCMIEFRMPNLGADMEAGTLREWKIKPGDTIHRGDILAVVETQKGLIEIETFDEGTIDSLLLKEDDRVPVGAIMALINQKEKETDKSLPSEMGKNTSSVQARIEKNEVINTPSGIRASPLARRIAAEHQIDLSGVKGTGEKGAISKEDVEMVIRQNHEISKEKSTVSTDSIRMAIAAAMSKSNREIPHYYLETKIDMSRPLAWLTANNKSRSAANRILPVVLFIKATARALVEFPDINAIWDNKLQRKKEINIGFVTSLRTGGIMIPTIHSADRKSIDEIMQTLNEIIPRARQLQLRSSDLSDSSITITNLGDNGVEKIFGIIYPPQVALIGFGGISEQPWAENGMLDVRPVLSITFAGDHRASDGQTGSKFLTAIKNHLLKPEVL